MARRHFPQNSIKVNKMFLFCAKLEQLIIVAIRIEIRGGFGFSEKIFVGNHFPQQNVGPCNYYSLRYPVRIRGGSPGGGPCRISLEDPPGGVPCGFPIELNIFAFFIGPEPMLDREGLKKDCDPDRCKPNRMAES